jgi:hypothetical protein
MIEDNQETAYLLALYQSTAGNPSVTKSMYEVGAALGQEKQEAQKTAETLIGKGWVEIKTLSGGIGITAEGIDRAQQAGAGPSGDGDRLGAGPLIDDTDRKTLAKVLEGLKADVAKLTTDYGRLEEMIMDIKTIEVHLLSPRPKTAVIKALLHALNALLAKAGDPRGAARIERLLG